MRLHIFNSRISNSRKIPGPKKRELGGHTVVGCEVLKRKYRRENDISDKNSHKMWFSFIGNNELEVLFGGRIHIVIT